jgi:hypothetical protein
MIQPPPDPSPESVRIVGYALNYWTDFVAALNASPAMSFWMNITTFYER